MGCAGLPAFLLLVVVLLPIAQVVTVRFVDPPFTLTMVQRSVEKSRQTGDWVWVDYRPTPIALLGPAPRAAVASEDAWFWVHGGFDWNAICGVVATSKDGQRMRGASTISQQVAKNVFLWQGRSWIRKGLEVVYTTLLELLVPKQRILELYLNVAETGDMTFGFEAASQRYYKKPADKLSNDQAGRIVGLLPNPRERAINGSHAQSRAKWLRGNPAPFPGDEGWERALAEWRRKPRGPGQCLSALAGR